MKGYNPVIEVNYAGIIAVIQHVENTSSLEAINICDAVIKSLTEERDKIRRRLHGSPLPVRIEHG